MLFENFLHEKVRRMKLVEYNLLFSKSEKEKFQPNFSIVQFQCQIK